MNRRKRNGEKETIVEPHTSYHAKSNFEFYLCKMHSSLELKIKLIYLAVKMQR